MPCGDRGGFVFAFSLQFLSRVFLRERRRGAAVVMAASNRRDAQVTVLRASPTSKETRFFADEFGFVYVIEPSLITMSRSRKWVCFCTLHRKVRIVRQKRNPELRTLIDPSRGIPCRRDIGVRGAWRAAPLPPNNGESIENRGSRKRWVRLPKAKIEKPLFSTTWWVRLCKIAFVARPSKMEAAPFRMPQN